MLTFTPVDILGTGFILVEFIDIKLVGTFFHLFRMISLEHFFKTTFFRGETTHASMILRSALERSREKQVSGGQSLSPALCHREYYSWVPPANRESKWPINASFYPFTVHRN
jgi:hypothetical protein